MVPLGERFPLTSRQAQVQKEFIPGCVIRVDVRFPHATKTKFLAIAYNDDEECLAFVINTKVHPLIEKKLDSRQSQVKIDCANHGFLGHDSYIACHEVLTIRKPDIIKELIADPSKIKGRVSPEVREQIVSAVKFARTISKANKSKILPCLDC